MGSENEEIYKLRNRGIGDVKERVVYFRYFCGGEFFEHKFPFDPRETLLIFATK